MSVLRSLAFYLVFYLGSIVYTSGSLAALPFDTALFRRIVRGWARWQRTCARWLLGIEVRTEGSGPVALSTGGPSPEGPTSAAWSKAAGSPVPSARSSETSCSTDPHSTER